ncbi:MAG TPA: extracellular solute-binding protein [candidate division Zixibacteria bacterium]|nr:extracellular solute-binding protein [candidate division Zixibacteria bacterium]
MNRLLGSNARLAGALASALALLAITAMTVQPLHAGAAGPLAEMIEGAKKEGIIRGQWSQNSFGGSAGLAELVAGMNRKYGLNLKSQFTPGPDMQRLMLRLAQEAEAGHPASTDVYLGNSQAIFDAMKANVLKPIDWTAILPRKIPSEPGFEPVAPGKVAVIFASAVVGVLYNSDLVKGDDVPRSLDDVLKPKWKGKVASTPYAAGFRELAMPGLLGREYVIDYVRKLSKQIGGLMRCGEAERITSGEFLMLVLTCGGNDVNVLQRTGAPVAHTVVKEGTVIHTRYAGVPKNSRSPNAGALLAAYLHTPEGQAVLWKHDGMDLHLYPDSKMKKEVDQVRSSGGKIAYNTPQWLASLKGYSETQKELEKILREGGK